MTGLQKWFENSKFESTITCEEGFPRHLLFEGLLVNNVELQDILTWTKGMVIQIWLEIKWQIYELRDMYGTRLLVYFRLYESKI